jgi:hypothetical protein
LPDVHALSGRVAMSRLDDVEVRVVTAREATA